MKQTSELMGESGDKDILFSKTVKAGKRVYYIDVKRDRRDAIYMAVTESKRVKEGTLEEKPVFEKHKIFLYREDMEKFMAALNAAVNFSIEAAPVPEYTHDDHEGQSEEWNRQPEEYIGAVDRDEIVGEGVVEKEAPQNNGNIKFDIDF